MNKKKKMRKEKENSGVQFARQILSMEGAW